MRTIFLFLFIMIISIPSFAGGPWPQAKGKSYFKLYEWWTVFDQHFTDRGLKDPNVTTGIFNTSIYAEYGITNKLTTVINAPLFSRTYMNNLRSNTTGEIIVAGESINTVGDIDVTFKYGLSSTEARVPISVSVLFGLPVGNSAGGSQGNLQTGDGEFNQLLQLDLGTSMKVFNQNAYVSFSTGFNNRTNGFSDEYRIGAEFGINLLKDKMWFISRLNVVESFKNGASSAEINSSSVFANNTEFASIGLELNYYLTERIGVSVGAAGAFRGEIIAAAPSYSIGFFADLSR